MTTLLDNFRTPSDHVGHIIFIILGPYLAILIPLSDRSRPHLTFWDRKWPLLDSIGPICFIPVIKTLWTILIRTGQFPWSWKLKWMDGIGSNLIFTSDASMPYSSQNFRGWKKLRFNPILQKFNFEIKLHIFNHSLITGWTLVPTRPLWRGRLGGGGTDPPSAVEARLVRAPEQRVV